MVIKKTFRGMTLIEMTAVIVVTGIIALGMTVGTRGVLLHYQTDHVRQDLRQYGNNIMREIVKELNLAQRVEGDLVPQAYLLLLGGQVYPHVHRYKVAPWLPG